MEKFKQGAIVGILGVLGVTSINLLATSISGLVEMKHSKMRRNELDKAVKDLNEMIEKRKEEESK